jgi:glycosyltransferase involved in cell wall biosynthesis
MMMSRPVVVPNESGLEDMVLVGVNGWRHDPISDWTDTMLTIASRPEQADVYGRAALREASHRYELNASAERLTRIYREALGE